LENRDKIDCRFHNNRSVYF